MNSTTAHQMVRAQQRRNKRNRRCSLDTIIWNEGISAFPGFGQRTPCCPYCEDPNRTTWWSGYNYAKALDRRARLKRRRLGDYEAWPPAMSHRSRSIA